MGNLAHSYFPSWELTLFLCKEFSRIIEVLGARLCYVQFFNFKQIELKVGRCLLPVLFWKHVDWDRKFGTYSHVLSNWHKKMSLTQNLTWSCSHVLNCLRTSSFVLYFAAYFCCIIMLLIRNLSNHHVEMCYRNMIGKENQVTSSANIELCSFPLSERLCDSPPLPCSG